MLGNLHKDPVEHWEWDWNKRIHDARFQTRHNFVGEMRIFSVKICINPYHSFIHRFIAKTFTRFKSRCSLQKNWDIVYYEKRQPAAKNQNRSFTSRGATVGLGLRLWLTTSIVIHGSPFFWKKLVVSTIKLFCFATHIHKLFFSNLPQICIISKKGKIRIGYGQSVPGGMSAVHTPWHETNSSTFNLDI